MFWASRKVLYNYGFIAHLIGFFDEKKIVLARFLQKKKSQIRLNLRLLAEMVDILPRAKQQPAGLIACGLRAAALFSSSPSSRKKGTSLS